MKNLLLIGGLGCMLIWTSCGDKEPEVNPLVKTWKLDEITIEVKEPGYESNNYSGDASGNYSLTFKDDLTYTRTVGEGGTAVVENGNWEQDGDLIDLDPEAGSPKKEGYFYRFTLLDISDRELDIEFELNWNYFTDAKVSEWISDGTFVLNEAQTGYIFNTELTTQEKNALVNEFYNEVTEIYNLNFDVVN